MHHLNIWLDTPNRIIEFGLLNNLTLLVMHIDDHVNLRIRAKTPPAAISARGTTFSST
jgi:hypothetical protein